MKFPFVLLILSLAMTSRGQSDCELRKSGNDIFVYACKSPDSKLKSISSRFLVETSPSKLVGHLLDVQNYSSWQYRMIATEVLERVSEREVIYRGEVQAPWPVSNRDLVVRLKISQDTLTKVMHFSIISMPGYIPKRDGVVRVPRSEGRWVVTPLGKNKLQVDYSFLVDPGGSIPGWLLNLTIAEGPYTTFKNLIARVKSDAAVKPATFIRD